MLKLKTAKMPMQEILLLFYKKLISSNKKTKYVAKIGSIIYALVDTQIDIAFATSMVSRFANCFKPDHFSAINHILRYLAGSQDKNIIFKKKPELCIIRYLDFNWVGDHVNKRSILRFDFTLNGRFINYNLKK